VLSTTKISIGSSRCSAFDSSTSMLQCFQPKCAIDHRLCNVAARRYDDQYLNSPSCQFKLLSQTQLLTLFVISSWRCGTASHSSHRRRQSPRPVTKEGQNAACTGGTCILLSDVLLHISNLLQTTFHRAAPQLDHLLSADNPHNARTRLLPRR
jgi:hypothetical protein